jgi:hydrophobic/amphiphilic exporter-1 (mainly G- bacteria), HAE1 family
MKALGEVPEAAEVTLVNDQSSYIRNAMRNLLYEVGLGAILVTLVVWIFLRRLLPTVAICGTIFLSILIGGLGFCLTGNTINVMTLGGLALAIGTVVDAGIVVMENVMRHLDMGKSRADAARDGASEVAAPVLAGTITTLAVFIPAIFLSGMIRYLFEPLSIAATLTIGSSYFIAMTVVPAFCARFVQATVKGRRTRDEDAVAVADAKVSSGSKSSARNSQPSTSYGRLLNGALSARYLVVAASVALVIGSVLLLPGIGSELFPEVDAGTFELRLKTRPGTRLEVTEKLVERIEATICGDGGVIPKNDVDAIISNIGLPVGKGAGFSTILSSNSGPDTAYLIVNLKQHGRAVSTQQYVRQLRERLKTEYPQEQFLFVNGSIVNMALNEGVPVPINVQVSAGSLDQCRAVSEQIVEKLRPIAGATDVQIAQSLDYPQLDVQVDRIRAKYLGLDQEEVAQTILTALGSSVGYSPTIWIDPKSGTDFFMGVQYENNEIKSLDELHNMPLSLNTPAGPVTIPLSNIATVKRVNIPGEIAHYNIARVNDVYVNVDGRDVGSVAADVERSLSEMEFANGVSVTLRGPVNTMQEGIRMLGTGLIVAAVLVYLVMLAQFKSWVDPLIIMLAVPLGLAGVLAMLFLTETTINIQSLMGTLMMIGVVVNNSILLVEFANQLLAEGLSPQQAAVKAAEIRLRPILMTSLTLVASMAPLSMHLAPGGEAMIPLARAVIGGMVASTVLTLFVVPCVYAMVKRPIAAVQGSPAESG